MEKKGYPQTLTSNMLFEGKLCEFGEDEQKSKTLL